MSYMKPQGAFRKAIGFVFWKARSFHFHSKRRLRRRKLKPSISVLVGMLCLLVVPGVVQAQDATFRPNESPAAAEWTSPVFTTSRDTRLEWNAYPLPNMEDPQFAFQVILESGTVIDTRTGLEGMGFVEAEYRVNLHVTCKQLYTWEIRVFYLKAPPLTSQNPVTTLTTEAPVTNLVTKTVTKEVTIAVFTELPPNRYLVAWTYVLLGAALVLVGFSGGLFALARKNYEVLLAKKAPPEEREE